MEFETRSTALESFGTLSVSEQELDEIFVNEKPFKFSTTTPLPQAPIDALVDGNYNAFKPILPDFNPKKAVVAQSAATEPMKLSDGSMASKTTLRNKLADGTSVAKTFVQQPGELYEEILDAHNSMAYMKLAVEDVLYFPRDKSKTALGKLMAREMARAEAETLSAPDDYSQWPACLDLDNGSKVPLMAVKFRYEFTLDSRSRIMVYGDFCCSQ